MGSASRLEFIQGDSDLDFFAVVRTDGLAKHPSSRKFSSFEKNLNQHIMERIKRSKKNLTLQVAVDGVPSPGGKNFYTENTIFGAIGKEHEPSWAVIERYHLLFESACCGGGRGMADSLKKLADECYCLTDDLRRDYFPTLCSTLLYTMMFSGVMAKVGHIRNSARMSEFDRIIFKTLFSRIWGAAVNLILLHLIYWRQLFEREWLITDADIGRCVRGSTIHKIVSTIPPLVNGLRKSPGKWLEVHCMNSVAARRAVGGFEEIAGLLKRFDGATLLGAYLTMMILADDIRRGNKSLNNDVVKQIRVADQNLRKLVGLVETQTWEIIRSRESQHPNAYFLLLQLIGSHLFRSAFNGDAQK